MSTATIRAATAADAAGCRGIYAPFVLDTAVSFEEDVPSVETVAARIEASLAAHAWLVAVVDGEVVGYAYATRHRERAAYRWACDVSVYLAGSARGRGIGRRLYEVLFARLADRGYVTALAGIALPNPASIGLHRAMGFEDVGVYRNIGFKGGSWHDVCWMQRSLVSIPVQPGELR
ncbi:arsinothricin resistance N-acetyltransferase ArsN1 family B [Jatrophihabitans sp. YIM 134969]